jgi:hypothetical protein
LPESIQEIQVSSMDFNSLNIFNTGIVKRKLPNLQILSFCNCDGLGDVYDNYVVPLSLKRININYCKNFK